MNLPFKLALAGGLYLGATAVFTLLQALENRVNGRRSAFWAPAWWIALTWPFWLIVVALDIPVSWPGGQFGRGRRL